MADSLAALGHGDQVLQYRAKGRRSGHDTDDAPRYLRRASTARHFELLDTMMSAHLTDDDHDAAIAAYTSALTMAPWKNDILYYLGKERLSRRGPERHGR